MPTTAGIVGGIGAVFAGTTAATLPFTSGRCKISRHSWFLVNCRPDCMGKWINMEPMLMNHTFTPQNVKRGKRTPTMSLLPSPQLCSSPYNPSLVRNEALQAILTGPVALPRSRWRRPGLRGDSLRSHHSRKRNDHRSLLTLHCEFFL